jgi:hypothetical protein
MIVRRPSPNVADPTWNDLVMKAVRSDHYNMEGRMSRNGAAGFDAEFEILSRESLPSVII